MSNKVSNIKERVLQIPEYKGITKQKFFKEIGMSYGNFTGKSKDTPLNSNAISNISAIYPDVNLKWLINGEGNMLLSDDTSNLPLLNQEHKGVPYYDVDFIGGFDLVMNDQSMKPSFYIDFSPFNDADYWVNITGKSMSPFISHGDLVALQEFDGWNDFVLFGEIYAIVTDHFRTIKIVGKGEDKDHLSLIPYSKSPEFSKQDIPKRLIRHMFKVKGSIKKFF
jgi:SOS-response transcriptional repressor LexA